MEANEIKNAVKEKYGAIAAGSEKNCGCSCGCGPQFPKIDYSIMSDSYNEVDGYMEDADLGLGCGIPTEFVNLREGETVLDLGSGAGNDCFIARKFVGDAGEVIGLDMTEEMVSLARSNAAKFGFANVRFVLGEIENMPIESSSVDAVLSNCVLNLVPDKSKAFAEMYRVIREGGRFSVSDIVLNGALPDGIKNGLMMYVGCVAGAMQKDEYLGAIAAAGFKNVAIKKAKTISMPDETLLQFITAEELARYRAQGNIVESVTVYAEK